MGKAIQIRDVPDDVHRRLKVRAAREGRTLSELLRQELEVLANTPTLDEVLASIKSRGPVELTESPAEAVRASRAERDRR
jgi:plasmid stability protein